MLFTIGVNWRELTFELTRNFLGWASPASPASGRPPTVGVPLRLAPTRGPTAAPFHRNLKNSAIRF